MKNKFICHTPRFVTLNRDTNMSRLCVVRQYENFLKQTHMNLIFIKFEYS